MPHFPNRGPSPRRPEPRPQGSARVLPPNRSDPEEAYRGGSHDACGRTGLSDVRRISIRNFEYDPNRVAQLVFGDRVKVDAHTGRMVHSR